MDSTHTNQQRGGLSYPHLRDSALCPPAERRTAHSTGASAAGGGSSDHRPTPCDLTNRGKVTSRAASALRAVFSSWHSTTESIDRERDTDARRGERGFTLIEVSAAVIILGAALTTIVTLQTRLVDSFVHERNYFRATLYAQYLITFLETSPNPPEPNSERQPLEEALRARGYFEGYPDSPGGNAQQREERAISGWEVETVISTLSFLELEDVARRIDLTVRWGPRPDEQSSLMLYVKSKD